MYIFVHLYKHLTKFYTVYTLILYGYHIVMILLMRYPDEVGSIFSWLDRDRYRQV